MLSRYILFLLALTLPMLFLLLLAPSPEDERDCAPIEGVPLPRWGKERTAICSWPLAYGERVWLECESVASCETELLRGSVIPPSPTLRGGKDRPGEVPVMEVLL